MHRISADLIARIAAEISDVWFDRYVRTAILEGAADVPPHTWTRSVSSGFDRATRTVVPDALSAERWKSSPWGSRNSGMYLSFVRAAKSVLGRAGLFDAAEDLVQRVISGETLPSQPGGELYAVGRQLSEVIRTSPDRGFESARNLVIRHIKQRALNEIRGVTRERARTGPLVQEGLESDDGRLEQYPGTTMVSGDAADVAFGDFLAGPKADEARRWLMDLWSRELRDSDLAVVRAWLNDPDKNYTQLGRELGVSGSFIGKAVVRARGVAIKAIQKDPPDFVRELQMREEVAPLGVSVRRASTLSPDDFWVQYPDPRTIRLLISRPGYSGFFEARVGPNQVDDLVRQLRYAGLTVDPDDVETAIEIS